MTDTNNESGLIPQEIIENKIYLIRGKKVMLDRHLAQLYGVETRVLNQMILKNNEIMPVHMCCQVDLGE